VFTYVNEPVPKPVVRFLDFLNMDLKLVKSIRFGNYEADAEE
jgi:hypothetical protein